MMHLNQITSLILSHLGFRALTNEFGGHKHAVHSRYQCSVTSHRPGGGAKIQAFLELSLRKLKSFASSGAFCCALHLPCLMDGTSAALCPVILGGDGGDAESSSHLLRTPVSDTSCF